MGYKIFLLCLRQLIASWKIVLRLSWFWVVIIVAEVIAATQVDISHVDSALGTYDFSTNFFGSFVASLLFLGFTITIIIGRISIAIGWHRYLLKGEIPAFPYFVPRHGTFWPYVWRGLKLGLTMMVIVIPLLITVFFLWWGFEPRFVQKAIPTGIIVPIAHFPANVIVDILLVSCFYWVLLRIGIGLPGAAIGDDVRFKASWQFTRPFSGAFITLAFLIACLQAIPVIMEYLIAFNSSPSGSSPVSFFYGKISFRSVPFMLANLGISIVSFFVGTAILTVIYGHLKADKPI